MLLNTYKIHYTSFIKLFLIAIIFGSAVGYGSIYLFHFVLVIILFILLLNQKFFSYNVILTPFFVFFIFFILWYLIGIIWSYNKLFTLQYIVYLLLGFSVIFIFSTWATTIERYKYAFKIIRYTVIFEFIIILLEVFNIFRWPTSPFSDYAVFFNRQVPDFTIYNADIVAFLKSSPTGFYGNPNNLAVFVASTLPFFLFSKNRLIRTFGIVFTIVVIIFTSSRGVFISFVFGLTIYIFFQYKRFFFILLISLLILSSSFSVIIDALKESENKNIASITLAGETLMNYLTEESTTDGSISLRRKLIKNGLDELIKTEGLGVGGGASKAVQMNKGLGKGSMHNFWIEILVEAGIFTFIAFVLWFIMLAYKLLSISYKTKDNFIRYISRSLALSMCIFSVGCISASSVVYNLTMWLMFGMGISIIYIHKYRAKL
jgi:teichuronic acid biosynthesis protein TuaE